ncbi:D-alanyl-D-alanine carboxypeptidase [Actinoplanes sp. TRM 88003]|uniref:D-alanyl-D-alanine carboxypeptidase n=1 Tax=Paractinoplanes aksuensis TaxID=2939490 RepID=A0ABT1DJV4_9ACTN|nr:D-alanyl-D-alanine carboxypeptidase [Actinoplanes aksuensis]MCO8271127.1 D-alanyl-D-alanine carboxypeptidase [Actinoplanes aksuensis]
MKSPNDPDRTAPMTPLASPPRERPNSAAIPAPRPEQNPLTPPRPAPGNVYGGASQPAPQPAQYGRGPTQYGGGTTTPRRRKRLLAVLITAVLLVALLGAGATAQLTRSLPAATLATTVAATMKVPGKAPDLPWPDQGSAELMIEGLGRLGGSGPDEAAPIGSVAKVMTAYVILRDHPLSGDEEGPSLTVTAADVADYQARIASNQSLVPVRVGEKLTERDAIEALMLPSANNIAHQLAIWDAGSESAFVDKMNAAADDLGMADTKYTDPSGYLPTTISTAPDQVKLARAALKSEVFAEIVALPSATIPVAGKIRNYNDLLGVQGVFGIKTGSTDEAGGCLLFAARLTVGGRKLTIVGAVFNQPGLNTPEQLANVNKEIKTLLRAVRQTVKQYTLLPADPVGEIRTAWGDTTPVRPATPLKVVGWPGLTVPLKVSTTAPGASVTAGQPVGTVQASGVRVDLRADATTSDPSVWWRLTRRT